MNFLLNKFKRRKTGKHMIDITSNTKIANINYFTEDTESNEYYKHYIIIRHCGYKKSKLFEIYLQYCRH